MTELVKITRETSFSLHHSLLGAARMSLKDAEAKKPGWAYDHLTCISMSGLALEAIANAFGERVVPEWSDYESSNPLVKLRTIAQFLEMDLSYSEKPWSDVKWLYGLRNKIAHSKPQKVLEQKVMSREDYDKSMEASVSSLEKQLTLGNARRAYETVKNMIDLLCDNMDPRDQFGLRSQTWTGSTESHDED